MDITLSGGDCGGDVLHLEAEPSVGDELTATFEATTLVYRYIGDGVAVFAGLQP